MLLKFLHILELLLYLNNIFTSCLGSLGRIRESERPLIFQTLKQLLTDKSMHIRNVACAAFQNTQDTNVINALNLVVENDSEGSVVRTALESIAIIKEIEEKEVITEELMEMKKEKKMLVVRPKRIEMMENRIIQK